MSLIKIIVAFTNWLQLRISGKIVKLAVVFPAPLQPAIMYRFGISGVKIGQNYFKNTLRDCFVAACALGLALSLF